MSDTASCNGEPLVTMEQLLGQKVTELKEELKQRGLPYSARNKEILAKRLYRHLHALQSSDESSTRCSSGDLEPEEVQIPHESTLKNWTIAETNNVPNIEEKDIHTFYSYHKHPVTGSRLNFSNMLTKAKKLCNEHHIRDIKFHNISDASDFCYFKSTCKASMKDATYKVTVCLNEDLGTVHEAYCTCPAGQSQVCCHAGALMFSLVSMKGACTNQGCEWLQPRLVKRPPSPKRFADITITNTATRTDQPPVRPYPGVYRAGPCNDPDQFLSDCLEGLGKVNPDCVLYRVMCCTVDDIVSFTRLYQPIYMFSNFISLTDKQDELSVFVDNIKVSEEVCALLETATKGQWANKFWFEARTVIITASHFGQVVKRKPDTPPDNLVKYLRGYAKVPETKAMLWGRKMESKAIKAYSQEHMKTCGQVIEVKSKGLVVSPKFPFLGASVDGILDCQKCGSTGIVEIKCPYKFRHMKPLDCVSDPNFCSESVNSQLMLKANHNYLFQVMGQMAILNLQWADFVVWTKKGISIQRITFSPQVWDFMLRKLHAFYVYGMAAELMTHRVKRGKQLY